ncbi:MAG: hypothetical protein SFW36_10860 [Leptolyngbyaceae cyanobacterium bins.59]|nr:hypothetical protein [Leptolyngbyaceae cyanobacterium bins.59]
MSRTRLKSALLSALGYLEANQDDVSTIPILVESYLAIAQEEGGSVEQVLADRGMQRMPNLAETVGELESEWDWAIRFAAELQKQSCYQVVVEIDITDPERLEIQVLSGPDTIDCTYPVAGIEEDSATAIAKIISLAFRYCGIETVETFDKSMDMACPECKHEWTIEDPEDYDEYCPKCEANCPADPVSFEVSLPDPDGEWHNLDYFSSHKEAIDYAFEHFGADEDGWIALVGRVE